MFALHEAYWRSRGVQVVECGKATAIDRQAELYMLIEPGHLVEFDLSAVTLRMTWNGATVMRLRLTAPNDDHYAERIELSDVEPIAARSVDRFAPRPVERIHRLYRTARPESHRLILTRSRDHAEVWQKASNRRQAWMRIRRSLPYYRVVHWRCPGHRFDGHSGGPASRYLHRLIQHWTDPNASLEGIVEIAPQVWVPDGFRLAHDSLVIGPAWLSAETASDGAILLVGPDFVPDPPPFRGSSTLASAPAASCEGSSAPTRVVRIRAIAEVEPGDRRRDTEEEGSVDKIDALTSLAPAASPGYLFAKRLFDMVCSAGVLLVASPLLAVLALAVLISDGRPIFYGHLRQSRGGRLFRCWKFRTMRRDADRMTRELQSLNRCDGPQFYIVDDPRVTRVGRFMRRYHLDELPQFWNVLIGDMSIVGPRPSPDSENQYCPPWREARLSVRPGITGLWQVERTRAPGLDFQEWIRFDTEYVRNAGFLLDCRILLKTIRRLCSQRHAPEASRPSSEQLVHASAGSAGDPTHPASG